MLLPAPVELPCRDNRTKGLCNRTVAVADLKRRFAEDPATADLLHLLCGPIVPGPVQSCTRPIRDEGTIRAVSGHMHLLGRAITVDVNKGTPQATRVLDIPTWNFDDQGSIPLDDAARRRTRATRSPSPAPTTRDCATCSRPSRARRTATSPGARARPTRCAWASSS